jgi:hypothetical protein
MQADFTEADVRKEIRAKVKTDGLRVTARRLKISPSYLSDVLNLKRGIGPKIAKILGYKRDKITVTVFRKESK